jgi:flagellar protein FlgJ
LGRKHLIAFVPGKDRAEFFGLKLYPEGKTMLAAQGISPATTFSPPLAVKPGATVKGAGDAKVKEMATEMEATFLGMLLKEMRQTLDEKEGGLFPGDTADVHGGLFDLYLSRHLADSGGIGLAAALLRQMQVTGPSPAPKTQHTDAPPAPPETRPDVPPATRA